MILVGITRIEVKGLKMSLVGKKAPDFKMGVVNGKGNEFSEVSLSDYQGKWLVLFFYPLDFTDV